METVKVGDLVTLKPRGIYDQDLLCSGFVAGVEQISGDEALVNSKLAMRPQATSFRLWWPLALLTPNAMSTTPNQRDPVE